MNQKNFPKQEKEFETQLIDLKRVVRVTAGGKKLRFRAVVCVGNKNGKVGVGIAKGRDVSQAIEKAERKAQKNLVEIPLKSDTILFDVQAKFGPAKVLLKPQIKGRGLVAGGVVRAICNLAGIKNISAKLLSKTRNKYNIAKATIEALKQLKIKKHANSSSQTKENK